MADDERIETLAERLGYPPDVVAEEEAKFAARRKAAHRTDLRIQLEDVARQLSASLDATIARLAEMMPGADPLAVVTLNGDPVCAPILASLGQCYAALAHLEVLDS